MLCLGSAVFYLTLSILSGIIASNSAYHKAARPWNLERVADSRHVESRGEQG